MDEEQDEEEDEEEEQQRTPKGKSKGGKGKSSSSTKTKKKADKAPGTSSRKHWTDEEETALCKYHDKFQKDYRGSEIADWDRVRPGPRASLPPPARPAPARATPPNRPSRRRAPSLPARADRAQARRRRIPGALGHRGARALRGHGVNSRFARRAVAREGGPGQLKGTDRESQVIVSLSLSLSIYLSLSASRAGSERTAGAPAR
jgi:hypothetical protein